MKTTSAKPLFLFRIDKADKVNNYFGTIVTGQILHGTICMDDCLEYVDQYQRTIFKCRVEDMGLMPCTRLEEASFEKMGDQSICLLIFRRSVHEFEIGDFLMKNSK